MANSNKFINSKIFFSLILIFNLISPSLFARTDGKDIIKKINFYVTVTTLQPTVRWNW